MISEESNDSISLISENGDLTKKKSKVGSPAKEQGFDSHKKSDSSTKLLGNFSVVRV